MQELRIARAEAGMTLMELEAASGVGASTISKIERGVTQPQVGTLRKLAQALGVEVEDFFREPAVPLAEAPREAGQTQPPKQTVEEFERTLAYVMAPVVAEALKEQQARNRLVSSEGRTQTRIVDPPEAEAGKRFLSELSPEERPLAFGEVALGRARFERDNVALAQTNADLRRLLREREREIAALKEENTQLREEHKRVEAEKA